MILFVCIRKRKFNDYSNMGYLKNGPKNLKNFQFHIKPIIKILISIMVLYIQYLLPPSSTSSTSQQPVRQSASLLGRFIYSSHINVVFENPNNRFRDFRNHRENRYSQAVFPYTVRLYYYGLLEQIRHSMLPVVLHSLPHCQVCKQDRIIYHPAQ